MPQPTSSKYIISENDMNHYKILNIIQGEDYKKIFPSQYYQKFGKHLKILQFEKNLFGMGLQVGKLKFTKRNNNINSYNIQNQLISESKSKTISKSISMASLRKKQSKQKITYPKVNVNKFAKVQDVIQQDRQELNRFKSFNQNIQKNIFMRQLNKQSNTFKQDKNKNYIRILETNGIMPQIQQVQKDKENQIKENILEKMYVISNEQQHQQIDKRFQQVQKQAFYCKFIKRQSKYTKSIINQQNNEQIKNRSKTLNINGLKQSQLNQQKPVKNINRYQSLKNIKPINNYISKKNMLSQFTDKILSQKQNSKKQFMTSTSRQKSENKQIMNELMKTNMIQQNIKNLINKTKQIKVNPQNNIQMLKHYQRQMENYMDKDKNQKDIQKLLKQKLNI